MKFQLKDKKTGQVITHKDKDADVGFEIRLDGSIKCWRLGSTIIENKSVKDLFKKGSVIADVTDYFDIEVIK